MATWKAYDSKVLYIFEWVKALVAPSVLVPTMIKAQHDGDVSLRSILRILKEQLAPTSTSTITSVRSNYKAVLKRAETRKGDQLKWYQE